MAIVGVFIKQPTELYAVDIDYTDKLPGSAVLSSGTVAAIDVADANDVSATVLASTTATITGSNKKTQATVQAGTDMHDYKLTFTTTLDNGNVFVDELMMLVRDL